MLHHAVILEHVQQGGLACIVQPQEQNACVLVVQACRGCSGARRACQAALIAPPAHAVGRKRTKVAQHVAEPAQDEGHGGDEGGGACQSNARARVVRNAHSRKVIRPPQRVQQRLAVLSYKNRFSFNSRLNLVHQFHDQFWSSSVPVPAETNSGRAGGGGRHEYGELRCTAAACMRALRTQGNRRRLCLQTRRQSHQRQNLRACCH